MISVRKRSADATAELRATLIEHARALVVRGGPHALTLRALANEANCAVGLPYKLFTDRTEIVTEIIRSDLLRFVAAHEELIDRADTATVADNIFWFTELIIDSPSVALASDVFEDEKLAEAVQAVVAEVAPNLRGFEKPIADYLRAEQRCGRVDADVDVDAFGFLIAGATHNLVVSGPMYLRPTPAQLRHYIQAVTDKLGKGEK